MSDKDKRTGTFYSNKKEIVITGIPNENNHNCDYMGCGIEHVIFRAEVKWFISDKNGLFENKG